MVKYLRKLAVISKNSTKILHKKSLIIGKCDIGWIQSTVMGTRLEIIDILSGIIA